MNTGWTSRQGTEWRALVQSLRTRMVYGASWNLLASVCLQGGTFAVAVLLANVLGREQFGQFAIVQSTLLTVATVAQLSMGYTATKYIAEFRTSSPQRAGRILTLCWAVAHGMALVAAAAIFFLAPIVARRVLGSATLTAPLYLASMPVLFLIANGFQLGALAGFEAFRGLARMSALGVACLLLTTWTGARLAGVAGAVAGLGVAGALQYALYARLLRKEASTHGLSVFARDAWRERAVVTYFAIPAALSGFSSMPALWLCNAILVQQPAGFAQIALFSAANYFRTMVLFLPQVLSGTANALLNHQRGNNNRPAFALIFRTNLAWACLAALAVACVLALAARPILALFGSDFVAGQRVLLLLLLAGVIEAAAAAIYLLIQSQERMWSSMLWIALPRDLLIVALGLWLIPRHGVSGLATTYVLACTISLLLTVVLARHVGVMRRPMVRVEPMLDATAERA